MSDLHWCMLNQIDSAGLGDGDPNIATDSVCDLVQITYPICASFTPCVKVG